MFGSEIKEDCFLETIWEEEEETWDSCVCCCKPLDEMNAALIELLENI